MKYLIFFVLLILPLMSVEAQGNVIEAGRTAIVGLPGVPAGSDFNTYMNALYALSIYHYCGSSSSNKNYHCGSQMDVDRCGYL